MTGDGWIVGDNAGRWRTFDSFGWAWTDRRDLAVRYARRADAELVHGEDGDCWRVEQYLAATRLAVPTGVGREEVARIVRHAVMQASTNIPDRFGERVEMRSAVEGEAVDALVSLLSHAEAGGVEVPGGWKLVPVERLTQFQAAVADIPEVAKRLQAGQQFNVYDSGANEDECDDEDCEMVIAIGPISRALWLGDTGGRATGQMIEAALKFAAEALAASPAAVAGEGA